jgi:hypothetical protein
MVIIGQKIQEKLQTLINQYVDYRTEGEYGISAFWYWYYQVMNYLNNMDKIRIKRGFLKRYRMPRWGLVTYSKIVFAKEVFVYTDDFDYSKRNLYTWLQHKSNRRPSYSISDTCYGFSSVLYDRTQKCGILKPDGTRLVKPIFDDIINFHHSTDDYSIIHAIGFIGNRVYSISMDGDVTLLHISKNDYINQKHLYDEMRKRKLTHIITEVINQYLKQNLIIN